MNKEIKGGRDIFQHTAEPIKIRSTLSPAADKVAENVELSVPECCFSPV